MTVIFDLNGTLTDPAAIGDPWRLPDLGEAVLESALQTAFAETLIGGYHDFSAHLEAALRLQVARRGLDERLIEQGLERARQLPAFPDAAVALDHLREHGQRLAVLTNSGADAGKSTLEAAGLADRFDEILGVDAVQRFKPHRATYEHALATLGEERGATFMVAAHAWDLAGAHAVGLRTVWIARDAGGFPQVLPPAEIHGADLPAAARAVTTASG
jgi:2-haloacid dehalogenase